MRIPYPTIWNLVLNKIFPGLSADIQIMQFYCDLAIPPTGLIYAN